MQAPVPAAGHAPAVMQSSAGPRLWVAAIAPARDPHWVARHMTWLSPSERGRFDRIRATDRRAQLLAGHVLLRRLVAETAGCRAEAVIVVSDADGRPVVETPAGWQASLAHSGQWVAALVSAGATSPGVDIEMHRSRRDIRAIVHAACGIDASSDDEAYLLWAQHEAELKAGPGATDVWVATWDGHAVAACAGALPAAARVELDVAASRPLELGWIRRPRLAAPSRIG